MTIEGPNRGLSEIHAAFSMPKHDQRQQVERRLLGQLLQTLLYEDIVPYDVQHTDNETVFRASGTDVSGERVVYQCAGLQSESFALIRLDYDTLIRISDTGTRAPAQLHQMLDELLGEAKQSAHFANFVTELEQSFIKDLQSRAQAYQPEQQPTALPAEALERHFMDAHSYHPCYKSRIGFSLQENQLYGPEFGNTFKVVWLAISKGCSACNVSQQFGADEFFHSVIDDQAWQLLQEQLKPTGKSADDFHVIPVHPWQWEHVVAPAFAHELSTGELLYLGESDDGYQAQQSIRTLQNTSELTKPYLKLSMSMTNTSSTRILAKHTVLNGPIITDWLQSLIETNGTARQLGFVILRETAGLSFVQDHLSEIRKPQTYGALGAIWRESIHQYLDEGESAVPFNGLSHMENLYNDSEASPFIAPWIEQHGLSTWVRQLLTVTVQPIIHMLYAEGVGMESHGQNIVLFLRDGLPTRIALKDFHDGVRYSPAHLARPELAPTLAEVPESHKKLNRNSFIITDDVDAVRDFSCDCFFFICLSDLAIFLRKHFALSESLFWEQVAEVIYTYQQQHPELASRFELFDLFAPTYEVEELTKRRLLGDGERRFKHVPNPLHAFRKSDA